MTAAPSYPGEKGVSGRIARLIRAFTHIRLSPVPYALLLLFAVLVRLLIVYAQRATLLPQSSPLDDMLMVRGAVSITEGEWLGAYGSFIIAKNMGFALWLALLHTLGISMLWGNALLWVACCAFAVRALRPLFSGNFSRLVLFCFLVFQPVSYAQFSQRAYRDAIFPAFCLLLFAGVLGLVLRLSQKRLRGSALCGIGAGLGLAGGWLLREDGLVLLVFALCAVAVLVLWALLWRGTLRRAAKTCFALLPLAMLGAGVLAFSAANAAHYGVFMVNDLTGGSFPRAYGAIAAVSKGESGHVLQTPVTLHALEKLCEEVPALAPLWPHFQEGPVKNGFARGNEAGEYVGSFYYALRLAAEYAGMTPTAPAAQAYWQQVAGEVALAVEEGRLQSAKPGASVIPRWDASLWAPAAAETARGFWATMTFQDCNASAPLSAGTPEAIDEVAAFLHVPVQTGVLPGTATPHYGLIQRAVYIACDVLTWLYRIAIWPLLALALWQMGRSLGRGVSHLFRDKKINYNLIFGIILLGLLLGYLIRLVVAAYMEVGVFGIGTYIMYLAGGVPALLLLCAAGAAAFGQTEHTGEPN